jgi:ABC-2 type transport system permease protein
LNAILRREFNSFFGSLVGFGIIGAFVVIMGLLSLLLDPMGGGGDWFKRGELSMRTFFGIFPWVAAVVLPAVSMRLWAEDRRQATFELLMTLPLPTWKVALGKYLAAVAFFGVMLLATFAWLLMLIKFGSPDWGPIAGGYLACFLLGAAFLAVGTFVSGLTDNQALAFFLSMLLCLGIVGMGELRPLVGDIARNEPLAAITHAITIPVVLLAVLAAAVGRDRSLGTAAVLLGVVVNGGVYLFNKEQFSEASLIDIRAKADMVVAGFAQASILDHFKEIERGVVNTTGLVFFASLIVMFVVLNVMSLESRRYG